MEPWGRVLDEITTGGVLLDNMTIMDKDGKILLEQPMQPMYEGYPNTVAKRGEVQRSLLDYATSIGVEVNLGAPVTEVFESDTSARVRIGDESHEADCVLAGDGVRSKARAFVTGVADRPKKSGYAIYRTWFPLDMLEGDSKVEDLARSERPIFKVWIAPEAHAVLTTNFKMRAATCFLTHRVCHTCERHSPKLGFTNVNFTTYRIFQTLMRTGISPAVFKTCWLAPKVGMLSSDT
jgi:2-polyprenyl-6-methoxyphenol hydroxylase-like FAD-dependent oxidoreductase